jgi:hypothetical protein
MPSKTHLHFFLQLLAFPTQKSSKRRIDISEHCTLQSSVEQQRVGMERLSNQEVEPFRAPVDLALRFVEWKVSVTNTDTQQKIGGELKKQKLYKGDKTNLLIPEEVLQSQVFVPNHTLRDHVGPDAECVTKVFEVDLQGKSIGQTQLTG